MATRRAVASGNWSNTATWNGGVIPTAGDTVYASSFTVAIDQNVDIGGANNPSVAQANLVAGQYYQITTAGTTNWTSIGAVAGTVGTVFLKNATAATGSGGVATALATITTAADTNAGAAAGGGFTMTTAFTLNADIRAGTTTCLTLSGSGNTTLGAYNIVGGSTANANAFTNNSSGSLSIGSSIITGGASNANGINNAGLGNITITSSIINGGNHYAIYNGSITGTISITSSTITSGSAAALYNNSTGIFTIASSAISCGTQLAIQNQSTGNITVTSSTITAGSTATAIFNNTAGSIVCTSCTFTASSAASAISSTSASATNRFSGTFIHSTNGYPAINATKWILNTAPTNSYFQVPLDGINANSFVRFYTADNSLGQANPTDVRTGVSYASGSLTGRLTVPAEGTVANGVTVGPNMPLTTATRSGTTATAFTAFPFPYQAADTIVVTGASNAEWNDTYNLSAAQNNPAQTAGAFNVGSIYTIASVGTTNFTLIGAASNTVGLTFTATGAGSGTGTATLLGSILTFPVPASHSASAGSGANAQTVGQAMLTVANIQAALTAQGLTTARAGNLDNLDTTVSSRLAPSGTLATVTNLTNAPASVTPSDIWSHATRTLTTSSGPTAVQIRQEMDSNSTKLANLDATVSSRLATSGYTSPTTPPTAAAVASQVRTELGTELGRIDAAISTRATPANIPSADITAIKSKTDLLNTTRLAQAATTEIVGGLLAQANS